MGERGNVIELCGITGLNIASADDRLLHGLGGLAPTLTPTEVDDTPTTKRCCVRRE